MLLADKKDSMLQELHETEDSTQKEDSVLEQCEQLSSRLREVLQAHKQDRYKARSLMLVVFTNILVL